jgi:predicted secreted protein
MVCNFAGADAGQQALAEARTDQTLVHFKVTFTDASTAAFDAYVMEYKISGKADSKVELALTLEITGAVAWQYPTGLMAEGNGGAVGAGKAGSSGVSKAA